MKSFLAAGCVQLSLALLISLAGCGSADDNMVAMESSQALTAETTDGQLGFVGSENNLEYWDMSDAKGSPILKNRPSKFDVAMSAFGRIKLRGSGQTCSGIKVYEEESSGKYNVYFLTAKHCFVTINELGNVVAGGPNSLHSFDLTSYVAKVGSQKKTDDRLAPIKMRTKPGVDYFERFYSVATEEPFTMVSYQSYGDSSDVVRIPIKKLTEIDKATATSQALPVCPRFVGAHPVNLESNHPSSMPLIVAYDSKAQRVIMDRLAGNHRYKGPQTGSFSSADNTISQMFSQLQTLLNVDEIGKRHTSAKSLAYRYNNGSGVEASDSGAPVLVGHVVQYTEIFFKNNGNGLSSSFSNLNHISNQVIIDGVSCVSGILSRAMRVDKFKVSARTDGGPSNHDTFESLGVSNVSLMQLIEDDKNAWR